MIKKDVVSSVEPTVHAHSHVIRKTEMNDSSRPWWNFSLLRKLMGSLEMFETELKHPEGRAVFALLSGTVERAQSSRRRWRFATCLLLLSLLGAAWFHYAQFTERRLRLEQTIFRTLPVSAEGRGEAHVAIIPIRGEIDGDPLGPDEVSNTPRYLYQALELAKTEHDLAAVVLYIDSNGGDLYASAESYRVVRQFSDEKKVPVYAYVPRQSYSGGYFIALAASQIIADPVAEVGNIGVIVRRMNTYNFGKRLGIEEQVIATGPRKDAGGQWKKANKADDAIDRRAVELLFDQFLSAVKKGRPEYALQDLRAEAKKPSGVTSGAWFAAADAKAKGLVDHVMTFQEFLRHVAEDLEKSKDSKYERVAFMKYDEKLSLAGGWKDNLKKFRAVHSSLGAPQAKFAIPGCSYADEVFSNALKDKE